MMPILRRRMLLGASGLVLAGIAPAWATETEVAALIRDLVGEGTLVPGHVKLGLPHLVENGNAVSMTIDAMDVPGRVASIHVFAGRNPLPQVVSVRFGPRSGRPVLETRIRLATSQTVIAVAKAGDGRCWSDSVDLLVTLAACIEWERRMARVLVNVPRTVTRNELFEVKVLISHPMESGQRRGPDGQAVPRKIINRFVATMDGEEVVSIDLYPAIAANPFLAFSVMAQASGTLGLTWVDDDGAVQTQLATVSVA